jgi:hypothetical protein
MTLKWLRFVLSALKSAVGMKLKTNFSKESPVWLLGKCYRRIESPSSDSTELGTDVAAFQSQSEVIRGETLTR